jgi:hypothetical protein
VAVIVRHFRCLLEKEARQTAEKAGQRGDDRKVGGRAEDWAATDQAG